MRKTRKVILFLAILSIAFTWHASSPSESAWAAMPPDGCSGCMFDDSAGAFCAQYSCTSGVSMCEPFNHYLCMTGGGCCCGETCGGGGGGVIITMDGSGVNTPSIVGTGSDIIARDCSGAIVARNYDSSRSARLSVLSREIAI